MTTIDELIEKAARKAARYVFDTWGDADGVVWSGLSDRDKEYARDCARAVLNVSGESVTSLSSLQERNRKLEEALRDFMENPLFQVAVGGNPNVVDEMLARNRALLSGGDA